PDHVHDRRSGPGDCPACAARRLRARAARGCRRRRGGRGLSRAIMGSFLSRRERFDRVGSTNDVVRAWLGEGTPEVCLAVADEQTAGRGREGREWVAPPGRALLLSLGF